MQFLTLLLVILLGGCALIFVLYPIYERMREGDGSGQGANQGDRRGRPYSTPNAMHNRSIVGAGLAPAPDDPSPTPSGPSLVPPTALENASSEREQTARTALQEIELDFQLGNLAESDYRSLRERYMRRALLAMKSRHDREQELDEAIEQQLRRMREMDEQAKEQ